MRFKRLRLRRKSRLFNLENFSVEKKIISSIEKEELISFSADDESLSVCPVICTSQISYYISPISKGSGTKGNDGRKGK